MVCVDHWSLLRYSDAGEPLKGSSCKGASNGRLQHLTCLFDSTAKGELRKKKKGKRKRKRKGRGRGRGRGRQQGTNCYLRHPRHTKFLGASLMASTLRIEVN